MCADTLVVTGQTDNLAQVRSFVRGRGAELGLLGDDLEDLVLATDEAVTNVILHGYHGGPGRIEISVATDNGGVVVVVRDSARWFDPSAVLPRASGQGTLTREAGGRGIYFMHRLLDRIDHRALPGGGNELRLSKSGRRRSKS